MFLLLDFIFFNLFVLETTPPSTSHSSPTPKMTSALNVKPGRPTSPPTAAGPTCNTDDLLTYGLKPAVGQRVGSYQLTETLEATCQSENNGYIADELYGFGHTISKGESLTLTCERVDGKERPVFNANLLWPNGRACGCHTDSLDSYGLKIADEQKSGTYRINEGVLVVCADGEAHYVKDVDGREFSAKAKIKLTCIAYSEGAEFDIIGVWPNGKACEGGQRKKASGEIAPAGNKDGKVRLFFLYDVMIK